MRKLRRKKKTDTHDSGNEQKPRRRIASKNQRKKNKQARIATPENLKKALSLPKRKKYKKQRCAFVDKDGNRCRNNAVGKSTLCKKHGGNPIVKDNLLPDTRVNSLPMTKFDPAVHPISFIQYAQTGMSDVEIAAQFEVGVDTLRGWAEKYESFAIAYEAGKTMNEAWWQRKGKEGLDRRFFNTPLFKFLTGNILGYSDKQETKSTNMHVHGVLVVPDPVSEDEWEADVIDADFEEKK